MRFNRKIILIIEDDRVAREIENRALIDAGYETYKSESSLQAFEILDRNEIDLIILDLNLPNVRGDHFLKILRNRPETRTIPVVVCSASGHRIDVIRCIKFGISDYIVKPFILKEFLKRIENAIKGVPFILKEDKEVISDRDYVHVLADEMGLKHRLQIRGLSKNNKNEDKSETKDCTYEDESKDELDEENLLDDKVMEDQTDEQADEAEEIAFAQKGFKKPSPQNKARLKKRFS